MRRYRPRWAGVNDYLCFAGVGIAVAAPSGSIAHWLPAPQVTEVGNVRRWCASTPLKPAAAAFEKKLNFQKHLLEDEDLQALRRSVQPFLDSELAKEVAAGNEPSLRVPSKITSLELIRSGAAARVEMVQTCEHHLNVLSLRLSSARRREAPFLTSLNAHDGEFSDDYLYPDYIPYIQTQERTVAFDELLRIVLKPTDRACERAWLTGPAGVGKSHVLLALVCSLMRGDALTAHTGTITERVEKFCVIYVPDAETWHQDPHELLTAVRIGVTIFSRQHLDEDTCKAFVFKVELMMAQRFPSWPDRLPLENVEATFEDAAVDEVPAATVKEAVAPKDSAETGHTTATSTQEAGVAADANAKTLAKDEPAATATPVDEVTKNPVLAAIHALRADLRADMRADMGVMRADIRADMDRMDRKLDKAVETVDRKLDKVVKAMDQSVKSLRADIKAVRAEVRRLGRMRGSDGAIYSAFITDLSALVKEVGRRCVLVMDQDEKLNKKAMEGRVTINKVLLNRSVTVVVSASANNEGWGDRQWYNCVTLSPQKDEQMPVILQKLLANALDGKLTNCVVPIEELRSAFFAACAKSLSCVPRDCDKFLEYLVADSKGWNDTTPAAAAVRNTLRRLIDIETESIRPSLLGQPARKVVPSLSAAFTVHEHFVEVVPDSCPPRPMFDAVDLDYMTLEKTAATGQAVIGFVHAAAKTAVRLAVYQVAREQVAFPLLLAAPAKYELMVLLSTEKWFGRRDEKGMMFDAPVQLTETGIVGALTELGIKTSPAKHQQIGLAVPGASHFDGIIVSHDGTTRNVFIVQVTMTQQHKDSYEALRNEVETLTKQLDSSIRVAFLWVNVHTSWTVQDVSTGRTRVFSGANKRLPQRFHDLLHSKEKQLQLYCADDTKLSDDEPFAEVCVHMWEGQARSLYHSITQWPSWS
jgi:hypothetical protein